MNGRNVVCIFVVVRRRRHRVDSFGLSWGALSFVFLGVDVHRSLNAVFAVLLGIPLPPRVLRPLILCTCPSSRVRTRAWSRGKGGRGTEGGTSTSAASDTTTATVTTITPSDTATTTAVLITASINPIIEIADGDLLAVATMTDTRRFIPS